MSLKLKNPIQQVTREITLPSEGYPYEGQIPGGKVLVSSFTHRTETAMYQPVTGANKELTRTLAILKDVCKFPGDFNPRNLLEGDLAYIMLTARSLSYPETYEFDTTCPHCGFVEKHNIKIPEEVPLNRYPSDFAGTLKVRTFNDNELELRFLTVSEDAEASRLARDRVAKGFVPKTPEAEEADQVLNRLCIQLVGLNGESAATASMEEKRKVFNDMMLDERNSVLEMLSRYAPGITQQIVVKCPECGESYESVMPMTDAFFRPRRKSVSNELPGGVRLGVIGETLYGPRMASASSVGNAGTIRESGGAEGTSATTEKIVENVVSEVGPIASGTVTTAQIANNAIIDRS